jgi:hypothetical protein
MREDAVLPLEHFWIRFKSLDPIRIAIYGVRLLKISNFSDAFLSVADLFIKKSWL